jgi:integrase
MRVKWNSSKSIVTFTLPYRVDIDKWSPDAQRCMARSFHTSRKISATIINRCIEQYEDYVEQIFNSIENITTNEFKHLFSIKLGKEVEQDNINIISLIDEFIRTESINKSWAKDTRNRFNTLKSNLIKYKSDFSIEDCKEQGITNFYLYLSNSCKFRNSHIKSLLKSLHWFLKWATKSGYIKNSDYERYMPKLKGTDNNSAVFYLTWEELMLMYNTKLTTPHLEQVKDIFIFCCFTSLRYSDVRALKKDDIKNDCIILTTKKTDTEVKIELNTYSRSILDKYKDYISPDNSALPVISNQNYNIFIKEVAKQCGINSTYKRIYYIGNTRHEESGEKWQFITTHAARRTFVVNAIYLGIPAEVIMRWTGHSDYKAMKPYIAIVDTLKQQQMNKFDIGPNK